MKKIRVIFALCSLLIAALAFFWLYKPDFSTGARAVQAGMIMKGFHLTDISEKGNLFVNDNESLLADVKTTDFSGETRLRSDGLTAWEFIFEGVLFTALPGGAIQYTPQTKELILENGEFYWQRPLGRQSVDISLFKAGNILRLSASGRLRLKSRSLEIWSYSGQIDFDFNGKAHRLQAMQFLRIVGNGKVSQLTLLPPPPSISPEREEILPVHINDTVMQFKWKNVRGADAYLLNIYSSPLRDSILSSRVVAGNSVMLDVLPLLEREALYWEVAAYDGKENIESLPSQMGVIKINGSMLKKGMMAQPPAIEVSSLSVSGNMVLIKGGTDPAALLTIDGSSIKLDSAGRFIYTISYRSIGVKEIVFRAEAPSGLTTIIKKQVTIFEE
jgi:hypothetical protein